MIADILTLVFVWVFCSLCAYVIHLSVGIATAGKSEVARQHREFVSRHGYRGIVQLVLTAGIIPRESQ